MRKKTFFADVVFLLAFAPIFSSTSALLAQNGAGASRSKTGKAAVENEQAIEAVFTARIVNRGDTSLLEPHLAVHLPMNLSQQTIAKLEVEGRPERKLDRWNAPIAVFECKELAPGEMLTGRWIAEATVRQLHWDIPRQDDPRGKPLSAEEVELYLRDAPNYDLKNEILAAAYREAVAGRTTTRERLEGIFDLVMNRLVYDRDGKWEPVPQVLASGKGSCSEYTYSFIALCRLGGIPARYVGGITGRASQPYFLDTVYHRCPQAYVPGLGWVDFDPTRTDRAKDKRRLFGRSSPVMLLTCVGDGGEGSLTDWDYLEIHRWKDAEKKAKASGLRMGWWFPTPPAVVKEKVAAFRQHLAEGENRGGLVEEALAIDHPYVLPWLDDLLYDPATRVDAAKACIKIGGDGVLRGVCNSLGRLADDEGDKKIGELLDAHAGQKFGPDRAKWNDYLKKNIPPSSL
ncbi:MAG: transglutaminase family protein [Pirellulales bacterium]|nr:transglutaminase family protein [Pirellulales bacterium]